MSDDRKTARLDFSDFKPRQPTQASVDPLTQHLAITDAKRLGFAARDETPRLDGRTLRRKSRVQLNIKVSLAVHHDFRKLVASEFTDSNECLERLLAVYKDSRSG